MITGCLVVIAAYALVFVINTAAAAVASALVVWALGMLNILTFSWTYVLGAAVIIGATMTLFCRSGK